MKIFKLIKENTHTDESEVTTKRKRVSKNIFYFIFLSESIYNHVHELS